MLVMANRRVEKKKTLKFVLNIKILLLYSFHSVSQSKGKTQRTNSFFVQIKTNCSCIFDSFLVFCTRKCLSPCSPVTKRVAIKKSSSYNEVHEILHFFECVKVFWQPPSPLWRPVDGEFGKNPSGVLVQA